MTAAAPFLIAQFRQAGATLTCGDDDKVRFSARKPLPAAMLAEARKHRDAIAAALTADSLEPCGAGGSADAWGFIPAERAAALARQRHQQSEAGAAAHTAGALPAWHQDGPLDPLPPAAAAALLAYIRDHLPPVWPHMLRHSYGFYRAGFAGRILPAVPAILTATLRPALERQPAV